VIKAGRAAVGLIVDSVAVELERPVAGVDGDRYGTNIGDGVLKGGFVS
jgi:hypothetical protein